MYKTQQTTTQSTSMAEWFTMVEENFCRILSLLTNTCTCSNQNKDGSNHPFLDIMLKANYFCTSQRLVRFCENLLHGTRTSCGGWLFTCTCDVKSRRKLLRILAVSCLEQKQNICQQTIPFNGNCHQSL